MSNRRDVVYLWPNDNEWHAVGLESEGDVRYSRTRKDEVDNETIKKVMQELGRRGGKSKSEKKKAAVRKSLEKARAARKQKRSQQNEQRS